ncbi:MAG: glycosyltransferase [Burkholderiales bacterium]
MITVSVVSHRQGELVADLLRDLRALGRRDLHALVTLNVPERVPFAAQDFDFPLELLDNSRQLGFAANHNQAFRRSQADFFCVLNPDIRLPQDPFPRLLAELESPNVGLVAPLAVNSLGQPENNARVFPTARSLLAKALGMAPRLDYPADGAASSPDWVAGMFMLFRRSAFAEVEGFDERYFLYYEDVDICRRLRRLGHDIRMVPASRVRHDARRTSHRNPRYLIWHLRSVLRYLLTSY